jgi:arabinofuranosyltransferase
VGRRRARVGPRGARDDGGASRKQAARAGAADWLLTHTPPGTTYSVSDAGLVPARAGRRTAIDKFMLNDPLIQRSGRLPVARRVADVYRRRPDVLVLASRCADRFTGVYATDRAMRRNPAFAGYRLATVARGGSGGRCAYHLFLYARAPGTVERWRQTTRR